MHLIKKNPCQTKKKKKLKRLIERKKNIIFL